VQGRGLGAVTSDVEDALERLDFPVEYHAEVLGDQADARADQERVWSLGVAAAIVVFLLLQAAFRSWRLAALVFATLPVALAGATVAAFLGIDTLSLAALIGFVAVFGIAVRHTVAVVKHLQGLELDDEKASRPDLVLRGSTERFTPTLVTALGTGLLMLPIVVFGGVAGLEVIRPAAIILLGGVVTTTLYSMLVVPALYLRFAPRPKPTFDSFIPHQASEPSRAGSETEMVTPRGEFDATR
jgi:Cu/Ag efflux pump CusA